MTDLPNDMSVFTPPPPEDAPERPMGRTLLRGWRKRCPQCGAGPLLKGYLKPRSECPVCSEDLSHARADDGPAYLTILIVGHLMGPLMIWMHEAFSPEPMVLATVLCVSSTAIALFMLPRLKGVIIAFQWAKRMHGFGDR